MSLHFTVSGSNVRTFLNVLSCVAKIGDAVYLVALDDGIELSAVTPSRNGHIAARIDARCFDQFAFVRPPPPPSPLTSPSSGEGQGQDNVPAELFLCMLAKTLMATVLRLHNSSSLQSIDVSYELSLSTESAEATEGENGGSAEVLQRGPVTTSANGNDTDLDDARRDADVVRWKCLYLHNMTTSFVLRLADGVPTSVCADATRYHVDICGEARTYGSLLASLPSSAGQCGLTLLENGGLELRSVSNAPSPHQQQQQATGSPSTADGSATVVTAFAKAFRLFRFFDLVPVPADGSSQQHNNSSITNTVVVDDAGVTSSGVSMIPPTPSQPPTQQQQQSEDNPASTTWGAASSYHLVVRPFVALPGKVFDVKPFKQAAWLAEQLGMQLRLRCGDAGTPLIFASITPEEVQELNAAATLGVTALPCDPLTGRRTSAVHPATKSDVNSGVSARSVPRSARFAVGDAAAAAAVAVVPACISFSVHVAALDVTTPSTAAGVGGVAAAATVGTGQETSVVTATSSLVNTPRASTHHPHPPFAGIAAVPRRSSGGGGDDRNADREEESFVDASLEPPLSSPANSVLASATRSSMNVVVGGSGVAAVSTKGGIMDVAVSSSSPSMVPATLQDSSLQPTPPLSGARTPSHVDASFISVAAASPLHEGKTVPASIQSSFLVGPSTDTTPRPSLSNMSDMIMVMTGGNTPETLHHTNGSKADQRGTAPPPLPPGLSSYTASLNSLYPLDFDAFARHYTTQADVDGNDNDDDAQDAELREFLASCVASMSRGPTQN
jgi:hypothetical protein